MEHLGEKLKKYRKEKGWNQFQMSDYLGFSNRKYQDIEKTGEISALKDMNTITQKTGIDTQNITHPKNEPASTLDSKDEGAKRESKPVKVHHKVYDEEKLMELLADLVKGNQKLIETNEVLAKTNAEQTQMLKARTPGGSRSENFPNLEAMLAEMRHKQSTLLNHLKLMFQLDAERDSHGDPKLAKKKMGEISKRLGVPLDLNDEKDTVGHKRHR